MKKVEESYDLGGQVRPLPLSIPATSEAFDEAGYLAANPDVRAFVKSGHLTSGRQHFDMFGSTEGRRMRIPAPNLARARESKLAALQPLLRRDMPFVTVDGRPNYLSEELRLATQIVDTENESANGYDAEMQELIASTKGLILDCGAGRRDVYYPNVVNFEIVAYDSTDVLGVGEALPFKDESFDAVLSIAVLEHVRDPFRCAAEIVRVLKPGGRLLCCMPFLQPYHGYPHHYFNATKQGLLRLFEALAVDSITVPTVGHPAFAVAWILKAWSDGLDGSAKEAFLDQRVRDLVSADPHSIAESVFGKLSEAKQTELACGFMLRAAKR